MSARRAWILEHGRLRPQAAPDALLTALRGQDLLPLGPARR